MARTNIPVATVLADSGAGVDLTAVAISGDAGNDHKLFNPAGRTGFLVWCDASGTVEVTVVSVADPYGRTRDVGPTTVGNSKVWIFGPFTNRLFAQQEGSDLGYTYINFATLSTVVKVVGLNM